MRSHALALASLAVLAIAPFLGGVRGGFIGDDLPIVRDNPGLREGSSILALFGETYWRDAGEGGLYRPLTVASFAIDRIAWGADERGGPSASGAHLTNLLLNAAATWLLYAILARRTAGFRWAWFGAALFAAHPVHTEAVVHLVGRADLLAGALSLGAFCLHSMRGWRASVAAPALYLAALFAKESPATLPAILFADAWLTRPSGPFGAFLRKELRRMCPYVAVLAVFLAIRGTVLGAHLVPPQRFALYVPGQYLAFENPQALEVPLTMLHAFGEYLRLLVLPVALSADYSGFPHTASWSLACVLSGVCWIGLAALAVLAKRRGEPEPAVWLGFFALAMLPVSNFVGTTGIVMAERVLYLPSAAFCAALAWGLSRLPWRVGVRAAAAGAALAAYCALSALRAPVWSDARTLFERTVEKGRHSGHIALNGLVGEYTRALQVSPDPALRRRALELAQRAVKLHPSELNLAYFAILLEQDGRIEDSLRCWQALRRDHPENQNYAGEVQRLRALMAERTRGADRPPP